MDPLGGKEAAEHLEEAIAEFQALEGAPPDELARAARRVKAAASAYDASLQPPLCHTHSPQTPSEECGTKPPLRFVRVSEFLERPIPEVEWLWEGVIPRGATVCLSAPPKVGKTTFVGHLVRAVSRTCATPTVGGVGGECVAQIGEGAAFLGHGTAAVRVAWVRLEEPIALFRARLVELRLGDRELFVLDPNEAAAPTIYDIEALKALVKEHGIELLIIDPLVDFLHVEDENDAALVSAALRPLRELAQETGCSVLLIHHDRKAEGRGVQKLRGSSAISGHFDVILGLSYLDGEREPSRRLEYVGRYGRGEFLCRLGEAGYGLLEPDRRDAEREEAKQERRDGRSRAKAERAQDERRRALELLRSRAGGVSRQEGATALGVSVNRIPSVFDDLVGRGLASYEAGSGAKPGRWFAKREAEEMRGGTGDGGDRQRPPDRGDDIIEEEV